MALFDRFPHLNWHELDLTWIICQVKKLTGNVTELDTKVGSFDGRLTAAEAASRDAAAAATEARDAANLATEAVHSYDTRITNATNVAANANATAAAAKTAAHNAEGEAAAATATAEAAAGAASEADRKAGNAATAAEAASNAASVADRKADGAAQTSERAALLAEEANKNAGSALFKIEDLKSNNSAKVTFTRFKDGHVTCNTSLDRMVSLYTAGGNVTAILVDQLTEKLRGLYSLQISDERSAVFRLIDEAGIHMISYAQDGEILIDDTPLSDLNKWTIIEDAVTKPNVAFARTGYKLSDISITMWMEKPAASPINFVAGVYDNKDIKAGVLDFSFASGDSKAVASLIDEHGEWFSRSLRGAPARADSSTLTSRFETSPIAPGTYISRFSIYPNPPANTNITIRGVKRYED